MFSFVYCFSRSDGCTERGSVLAACLFTCNGFKKKNKEIKKQKNGLGLACLPLHLLDFFAK